MYKLVGEWFIKVRCIVFSFLKGNNNCALQLLETNFMVVIDNNVDEK